MINLATGQSLFGSATIAASVTCTVYGDILSGTPAADAFQLLYQGQLESSPASLKAAASGQQILIGSIFLSNLTSGDVGVSFYSGGGAVTNQLVANITVPAGGSAAYEDKRGWLVYDSNGLQLLNSAAYVTLTGVVTGTGAGTIPTTLHVASPLFVDSDVLQLLFDHTLETGSNGLGVITTELSLFTSVARGVVPPSGGGTAAFLRADGTWADPTDTDLNVTFPLVFDTATDSLTLAYDGTLTVDSNGLGLPATGVIATSYGSATQVGTFTVDSRGRITAAANVTIAGTAPGGSAGGDLAGTYPNPTLAAAINTAVNFTGAVTLKSPTLGSVSGDTITQNAGIITIANPFVQTHAVGAAAAGAVTDSVWTTNASGDVGGTTQFNSFNYNLNLSGGNAFSVGRMFQGTLTYSATANVANLQNYRLDSAVSNSGGITSAGFGFGSKLSATGGATIASWVDFSSIGATVSGGSAVTTKIGFDANGAVTGETTHIGFRATSSTAATTNIGFQGTTNAASGRYNLSMSGTAMNILAGSTSIGKSTDPTALLHLGAGTATASTAPLKFNSGTLLTTAEAGAMEFLTDKAYITITTGAARKEYALWDAAGTSGRVPFETTNGRLTDASTFTYTSGSGISVDGITMADAKNFAVGTTTGTKIGTATTQKLGFFNAAPVVQPATTGTTTGYTANTSANFVYNESTFTGGTGATAYRISDVVLALKNLGLLAA